MKKCFFSAKLYFSPFFFSAHFPHQCVVALLFGYLSCQFSVKRIGKLKKTCLAVFCLLSALTVYFKAEFLLGFDINWSLQLAHRHCQKVFFHVSYLLDVLRGHPSCYYYKRGIFQTFWKPDCCPDFLFLELETSNFGYLPIF